MIFVLLNSSFRRATTRMTDDGWALRSEKDCTQDVDSRFMGLWRICLVLGACGLGSVFCSSLDIHEVCLLKLSCP